MERQLRKTRSAPHPATANASDGAASLIAARHRNDHLPSDLSAISRHDLYSLSSRMCRQLDGEKSSSLNGA